MRRRSIFCVAKTESQAINVVDQLKVAQIPGDEVSLLLPDKTGRRVLDEEAIVGRAESVVPSDAILGGAAGWLSATSSWAVPGLGAFFVAGPILQALSGTAVGGALDGITSALEGFGISESEAKRYAGKIRSGQILISVHTASEPEARRIKRIFGSCGTEQIAETRETPANFALSF